MKVILLAAGFGSRLKPITNYIPKCLVPIGGRALLDIWIKKLEEIKVKTIIINTHYLHLQVNNFIKKYHNNKKIKIKYEKILLGTAGTLLKNIDLIKDSDCLLIHADNYCEDDLKKLIVAHKNRPKSCLLTMMVFKVTDSFLFGIVNIDKNRIVRNYFEKNKKAKGNLANAAIYVLSKKFLIKYKKEFKHAKNFSTDVLPFCINKIYVYKTNNKLIDIGTLKNYNLANKSL